MIYQLLQSTLLNNITFLGYNKKFTSREMVYDLIGTRKFVEIHNINHTLLSFWKSLGVITSIWNKFSCLWIISPFNAVQSSLFHKLDDFLDGFLHIWYKKWRKGFLTNSSGFLSMQMRIQYPATLFYLNYTTNSDKLEEARLKRIITVGIADSNSSRRGYNYLINANETNLRSYMMFSQLIFSRAIEFVTSNRRGFLMQTE